MKKLLSLLSLMMSLSASAGEITDELGWRFSSRVPDADQSIIAYPPSRWDAEGKQIHFFWDHYLHRNFYLETGVGYTTDTNIFDFKTASPSLELSPGFKVNVHGLVLKMSIGASYQPGHRFDAATWTGYNPWNTVHHVTIGFQDDRSGFFLGFDRVHYSNGQAANNPALNYSGFLLSIPIGRR